MFSKYDLFGPVPATLGLVAPPAYGQVNSNPKRRNGAMGTRIFRRLVVAGAALAVLMLGFAFAPAKAQSEGGPSSGAPGSVVSGGLAPPASVPPPLSLAKAQFFKNNPAAWAQFLAQRSEGLLQAPRQRVEPPSGGTWHVVTTAPGGLYNPLLLTDGTVIAQVGSPPSQSWYKLTPTNTGSYAGGTWSPDRFAAGYKRHAVWPAISRFGGVARRPGDYSRRRIQRQLHQ